MTSAVPVGPPQWGRSVSYVTWRLTTELMKALVVAAVICLVSDLVIWGLTFASPSLVMPDWIFAPFFAFGILGTLVTVAVIVTSHGRHSLDGIRLVRRLPVWLVAGLIVLGAVFFITGPAQLFRSVPGQPGYNASTHQYYFDNHGEVIPTDRAHYLSAVATQTRFFLSFAIVITCVMILLSGAELRRRRVVTVPRLSEIPIPSPPLPRLCPAAWVGLSVGVLGLLVLSGSFTRIVQRVDSYLAHVPAVTTAGVTEHLSTGPWVVFTWCETHATDAPYGCSQMAPTDIVIRQVASGTVLPTAPDPSIDHMSPDNLPAAGQLTFSVVQSGSYELRLTREVPNGVFVARSPGTIARSLAGTIALAVLGLASLVLGVALLIRRALWRLRLAPRVIVPDVEFP
jgi:hypothetical protein